MKVENEIFLTRHQLNRIHELFIKMVDPNDQSTVTLKHASDSFLTATFFVKHRDEDGEFTVTISNTENW